MFEVILIKLFGVLLSLKEEVYERGKAGEEWVLGRVLWKKQDAPFSLARSNNTSPFSHSSLSLSPLSSLLTRPSHPTLPLNPNDYRVKVGE